ncbi:MAG: GntR family transcriptional regulator [Nocardioides sp.]|uniref:GntR family transcriptional regulator n=1 Tax=Nocardioides sp. TaxID=35761 RepID=UPI0039E25E15
MPPSFFDENERRLAHMQAARDRARAAEQLRLTSIVGAHGALFTSIRRGSLAADDRLDEATLVPMFSASRNSIRGALKLLAAEGVVSRSPRLGTKVVSLPVEVPINVGNGWDPAAAPHQTIVTDARWVASTPVSRHYLRTEESAVFQLEVTDLFEGRPALLYTRFTLAEGAERPLVTGEEGDDFHAVFKAAYGSPLARVECWIEAKAADESAARRLEVEPGTPLIVKSRVLWDATGAPREYSIGHYPAATVSLTSHVDAHVDFQAGGLAASPADAVPARTEVKHAAVTDEVPPEELRHRSIPDLHTEIRTAIRDGMVSPGAQLDEHDIEVAFGADPTTVHSVVEQLRAEGLVRRDPATGTLTATPITDLTLDSGVPYSSSEGPRYEGELLASARIQMPPFLGELLPAGSDRVLIDEHLVRLDGRPIMIFVRYSDGRLARPRTLTLENTTEDFETLFTRSYGLAPGRIESWVHAIRADDQIAPRLQVRPGSMLLLLERLTHDAKGELRELSHSYIAAGPVALHAGHEMETPQRMTA